MPTLDWIIICDDVRAEVGDKISLMGLFDMIWVQSFPALHPRLAIVASWSGLKGDSKSKIEIVSENGELVQPEAVAPLKAPPQGNSARHITISFNVQFKSEGIYQVRVSLNNDSYRSVPLPVRRMARPS
jgi:hypothetical protein